MCGGRKQPFDEQWANKEVANSLHSLSGWQIVMAAYNLESWNLKNLKTNKPTNKIIQLKIVEWIQHSVENI